MHFHFHITSWNKRIMANLRATNNHVFTKDDLVGRGATCEVYKGIDKNTGETHALKIFEPRLGLVSQREIEALKTLTHPNIVQFLNEEKENGTGRTVAVMEYCDKSLYGLLCEPENKNGLSEDEYVRFFTHIVAGMKHLREQDFLHRDIKPGNILLAVDEDGSYVYKLSDFGTAKPVLETEAFQSLVGTEEYLHPDIFRAAFIDHNTPRTFDSSADLWSLGATLYHAATGKVPFRPFRGRDNRLVMFSMIARKEFGVISGEQKSAADEIDWSRDMPATCRLSRWLKQRLTTILAHLMEKDLKLAWNFDTFFQAADDIAQAKILHVFTTTSARHFMLYMEPNSKYETVQKDVQKETNIPPGDQILYHEESYLCDLVPQESPVSDYPVTSITSPLVLIRTTGLQQCTSPDEAHPWYKDSAVLESPPSYPVNVRLDDDFRVTRSISECVATIQDGIHLCCVTEELFWKTIFRADRWKSVIIKQLKKETSMHENRLNDLSRIYYTRMGVEDDMEWDSVQEKSTATQHIQQLKSCISKCKSCVSKVDSLTSNGVLDKVPLSCKENKYEKRIERLLQRAKEKREKFEERRRLRSLPYHEEQLHKFDRKEMLSLYNKAEDLGKECSDKLEEIHKHFLTWHRQYTELQSVLEDLQRTLAELPSKFKHFIKDFTNSKDVPKQFMMSSVTQSTMNSMKRKDLASSLVTELSSLQTGVGELNKLVMESNEHLKSFEELAKEDLPTPEVCGKNET